MLATASTTAASAKIKSAIVILPRAFCCNIEINGGLDLSNGNVVELTEDTQ